MRGVTIGQLVFAVAFAVGTTYAGLWLWKRMHTEPVL